jgi:hypothetical protein
MDNRYCDWLAAIVPTEATARTKLSELRRVESAYGDLDEAFDRDELESVIADLTYSAIDARNNEPNPSRLKIDGDLRNNLASYKSAVNKYVHFRREIEGHAADSVSSRSTAGVFDEGEAKAKLSLERDLQTALRRSIEQLEPGLVIADGGTERSVPSGRIDILAKDAGGVPVLIELKAVTAPRDAVAQVLAYMGDIQGEIDGPVRGILVAPDFDARAISAARMVPSLSLFSFRFSFQFDRRG